MTSWYEKAPWIVAESGRLDGVEFGQHDGTERRLNIQSRTQIESAVCPEEVLRP